ncbi:MAG: trypsin-like peptidase domain-containing protein [Candidatus Wallbacteria bacterium]|nr:trypsin-like peptidase domain-containing protein [Candidatus Wallbacteria bacterium]
MKQILLVILIFAVQLASEEQSAYNAVIKVFAKRLNLSCYQPWSTGSVSGASGTGFVLSDGSIVTNAHMAKNNTTLWLKRTDRPQNFPARVKFIGHDCDLALLETDDLSFYDGLIGLQLGEMPDLNDKVTVVGYPTGGEKLSYTEGIISRLEYRLYVHDGASMNFAFQTDAAINPGNSGGPVMIGNKVVGVAFQANSNLQSVGHFIPLEVLRHFLVDVTDGNYEGFPELLIDTEQLQSETQRQYLGTSRETGILVCNVSKYSPVREIIKPGDVLTSIDSTEIGIDEKFDSRWGRISYNYLVKKCQISTEVEFGLLRDKLPVRAKARLGVPVQGLRKSKLYDQDFQYYSLAGYVFQPFSRDYLETWGDDWQAKADPLFRYYYDNFEYTEPDCPELVILSRILPLEVNNEFDLAKSIVASVNGEPVKSFQGFRKTVERLIAGKTEFLFITFRDNTYLPLLIPVSKIEQSDLEAHQKYQVPLRSESK